VRPTPSPIAPTPTKKPTSKSAKDGDIDGDGRVDSVTVAATTGEDGTWLVTAHMTSVGESNTQLGADTRPQLRGIVDADGDGRAEVWLRTHSGASTEFLTPLRLYKGEIVAVHRGSSTVELGVGGSVTHGNGFACKDTVKSKSGRELIVYEGSTSDTTHWSGDKTTYDWSGATLVRLSSKHESFSYSSIDDPRVAPYYSVDCGSLSP
jgi:hypothetical protein